MLDEIQTLWPTVSLTTISISCCVLLYGTFSYQENVWFKRLAVGLCFISFIAILHTPWLSRTIYFPLQSISLMLFSFFISYATLKFTAHKSSLALLSFPIIMMLVILLNLLLQGTGGITPFEYWLIMP